MRESKQAFVLGMAEWGWAAHDEKVRKGQGSVLSAKKRDEARVDGEGEGERDGEEMQGRTARRMDPGREGAEMEKEWKDMEHSDDP